MAIQLFFLHFPLRYSQFYTARLKRVIQFFFTWFYQLPKLSQFDLSSANLTGLCENRVRPASYGLQWQGERRLLWQTPCMFNWCRYSKCCPVYARSTPTYAGEHVYIYIYISWSNDCPGLWAAVTRREMNNMTSGIQVFWYSRCCPVHGRSSTTHVGEHSSLRSKIRVTSIFFIRFKLFLDVILFTLKPK